VVVDVVPASLLARLSVHASSPEVAHGLVLAIADEVIKKNLLAAVGELRLLDEQPTAQKVAPDMFLAAGLALAAGVAAAATVLILVALMRPSMHLRIRRELAAAGINRRVGLVHLADTRAVDQIKTLAAAAATPVRVAALTPLAEQDAERLSAALSSVAITVTDGHSGAAASVVGVVSGKVLGALSSAVIALPENARLVAIAIAAPGAKGREP
jgi:hypothetical protein